MKLTVDPAIGQQIICVATMAAILESGDRMRDVRELSDVVDYAARAMNLYSAAANAVILAGGAP